MTTILTRREAHCVLGLLAAAPAVVTAGALAASLDLPQASVKASLHAINARLASEAVTQHAFIEHRAGHGWIIFGRGGRLESLYREALAMIARDAGTLAADAKAGQIIVRPAPVKPPQPAVWFG